MYIAAHQWHCTQRNTCIDIVFSNSKWVWRGQFSSVLQLCALIKACSDAKKKQTCIELKPYPYEVKQVIEMQNSIFYRSNLDTCLWSQME